MQKWGRRIRAALGIGLAWAVVWSAAGAALAHMPGFSSDLPFPLLFAPLGFITGVLFSAILVAIEARRRFDRMSLLRFGGWGAMSGLLLSGIFVAGAAIRGASLWGEFLVFGPALTLSSAICAAGSLAMAGRGETRELPMPRWDPSAIELTDAEKPELLGRGD